MPSARPSGSPKSSTPRSSCENGFHGLKGQTMPEMGDYVIHQISERFIELYETVTDLTYINADMATRVKPNMMPALRDMGME